MTRVTGLIAGVAVAAFLALAGLGYASLYARPRAALMADLTEARESAASYEAALEARKGVRDELKRVAATTLGVRLDAVEHQFRTRLGGALESCGLSSIVVSSGSPAGAASPAAKARLTSRMAAAIKARDDFQVLRGRGEGQGTLEQVLRAMTVVEAQTWVHRVEGFTIEPMGRERERFRLVIDVATLYLPSLAPENSSGPEPVVPPENVALAWGPIVAKNVFRKPPPEAPARPPPAVVAQGNSPVAPPAPLYDEWRLTGLARLPRLGWQALVYNTRTSESRHLAPGEGVLDLVFESAEGERAVFRMADRRYEILSGQSLAQRKPVN